MHIVDLTGRVVLATGEHDVACEVVLFWRHAALVALHFDEDRLAVFDRRDVCIGRGD